MKVVPEPKSLKLLPTEWDTLQSIAQRRGMSRHRLLVIAARNLIADAA